MIVLHVVFHRMQRCQTRVSGLLAASTCAMQANGSAVTCVVIACLRIGRGAERVNMSADGLIRLLKLEHFSKSQRSDHSATQRCMLFTMMSRV
jgi:hypothetical protein